MALIVFEGLNGSGKSSLSKSLATKLNWQYVATPHKDISQLKNAMDEVGISANFFYYMLGNILVSDDINNMKLGEMVVCDRYIDSTIAHHAVLGLNVRGFDLTKFNLLIPDLSFFIYCDEKERRERVEKMGKKSKWDVLDESDELRSEYIKYFQLKKEYIFIDNSQEKEEETLCRIINILNDKGFAAKIKTEKIGN